MDNFAPYGARSAAMTAKPARVLVIAGSDSGGGAGIQADIKTITMLGGHAMTAVTAVTAQNTTGVTAVHPVPAEVILAQIDAVVEDIGVDAVKIGMIGSVFAARQIALRLERLKAENPDLPIVFDPVMVATSGSSLADEATIAAFGPLMDLATITTPNLPELARLSNKEDPVAAALGLVGEHGCAVLIKGGHGEGSESIDYLFGGSGTIALAAPRLATENTHGTGCTLSSAIAAGLAKGHEIEAAVRDAKAFVSAAIAAADRLEVGQGHGPLHHFYRFY